MAFHQFETSDLFDVLKPFQVPGNQVSNRSTLKEIDLIAIFEHINECTVPRQKSISKSKFGENMRTSSMEQGLPNQLMPCVRIA